MIIGFDDYHLSNNRKIHGDLESSQIPNVAILFTKKIIRGSFKKEKTPSIGHIPK